MEFCRDAKSREESSNPCSWCSNNRWVGPERERIPQAVPDSNNPGHFMDIYQTESTGRTPDDYLPRKCSNICTRNILTVSETIRIP